ncbi:MAG: class I fructose-bisphosphate aldolase [Candidatus Woesearchaeota archaeon]
MKINVSKLMKKNRSLFLACDQGLEHGPKDFNLKNIDPTYILDIALEGNYNGVILQHGLAEKYYHEHYKDVPLIVKLNGKTALPHIEPISKQLCSVDRAIKLGASAVGYTLFPGSEFEPEQFENFGKVVEQAHDAGLPVIAWMYPRGKAIPNDEDTNTIAHAARIGLELGADFLKLKYNHDVEGYKWVVKNAGRARVLTAGGTKETPEHFLRKTYEILQTGATGLAIGRNIWQSKQPFSLTHALREIIFNNKKVEDVLHYLNEK